MKKQVEQWKQVKGYENMYEVSNFGNVRSLDRVISKTYKSGERKNKYKGKVLKKDMFSNFSIRSVPSVCVINKGKRKVKSVIILVAESFLEYVHNGISGTVVKKIDNNPLNDRLDNIKLVNCK